MYMINNHSDKAGEFQDLPFSSLHLRASEGGTPNTKEEEYYTPKDIPFIKIEDLKEKYIKESKFHISKKGLQKSSAWLIPENSVIFSNGATIGEVAINIFPIATKQGILGIIPNRKKIETEYLYYIMKSSIFRKRTNMITTRGTISTAYIKDINNIRCKIPNLKEQMKFIKNIDKLEKRLENEKNLFSRFNNLKKYLLNNMFI